MSMVLNATFNNILVSIYIYIYIYKKLVKEEQNGFFTTFLY